MNINVNIERIVFDGDDFAKYRAEDIRTAIAAQLAAREISIDQSFSRHRTRGSEIDQRLTSRGSVASRVATSICSAIES